MNSQLKHELTAVCKPALAQRVEAQQSRTHTEISTLMGGICFQLFHHIYHHLEGLYQLVQKTS